VVTAVAVWTILPTPDALLRDRVHRGWKPLASAMAAGPQVLGFAAKLG